MTQDDLLNLVCTKPSGGCVVSYEPVGELAAAFAKEMGYRYVSIEGSDCRTSLGLFDAWSEALTFPWYFGRNWDAFDEVVRDRDFTPRTDTMLVVRRAGAVLNREDLRQDTLMRILGDVEKGRAASNYMHMPEVTHPGLWIIFDASTRPHENEWLRDANIPTI